MISDEDVRRIEHEMQRYMSYGLHLARTQKIVDVLAIIERMRAAEAKLADAKMCVDTAEMEADDSKTALEAFREGDGDPDADLWAEIKRQRDVAVARAEKAEAIVAKLPRTADGVPIVYGMEVWYFDENAKVGERRYWRARSRFSVGRSGGRIAGRDLGVDKGAEVSRPD